MNESFQFPEVRVVEASAGSGKTYALAKRYVQLLLHASEREYSLSSRSSIRHILALTFTNKAAFEMKARILEFLKSMALKKMPEVIVQDILAPIGLSSDTASKKAFVAMEDVIHHYNFFQVQTIDKFINALISGCAFKVGLTANFRIKTNPKEQLLYSLDQLIDTAATDKTARKMVEDFLKSYLYLENRLGWFPKKDMLAIIVDLFSQSNTYGQEFKISSMTIEDLIKNKGVILENMKALRDILPEHTNVGFCKNLDKFLANHTKGFDVDSISDYFAREDFPVRKGCDISDETQRLWKRLRKDLKQLCEDESYLLFNPYLNVFQMVIKDFYIACAKEDILFLSELNKKAGRLFDEDYVTVEELYYRLATKFHHYLIDEFQDTSRLQWHNLMMMIEEAVSGNGSLFYVGDKKQAIYSFRGGDAALFDDVKKMYASPALRLETLTNNWRSAPVIVAFNNAIFSMDNLRRFIKDKEQYEIQKKKNPVCFYDEDFKELENVFGTSHQIIPDLKGKSSEQGFICVEFIDSDKKQQRDSMIKERLIDVITELRPRFRLKDIAILTRGNNEIEQITNWLLESEIWVESERTSNIQENTIVKELLAFLQFLHSPVDNLSFSAFILGEIFARATGLTREELRVFVFGLRERLRREKNVYLYVEFRKTFHEVWTEFIEGFFKNIGLYPLYELVVSIYHQFNVLKLFTPQQGFLMHLLELIKKMEEDHSDVASFLEYFTNLQGEDLYVHLTDTDAVKVLTIHKAKGLEFPVVILPFFGMNVQVGSTPKDYSQSYILRRQQDDMQLLRKKEKYLKFSEHLYQIYSDEYKKAFITELNNVYVALTRAEKEIYAFIPKKMGSSFNAIRFLIPEERYTQGQISETVCTSHKNKSKTTTLWRLPPSEYHDWISYLNEEFKDIDQLRRRKERLRGEVLHFLLSFIGNLDNQDKEEVLSQAQEEARGQFGNRIDMAEPINIVQRLLDSQDMRRFFYFQDKDAHVYSEKEIVNGYGHVRRIDRLIIKKEEVWVVDYKSSAESKDENVLQIQEYARMIQPLYPQVVVKGFLVYLDTLTVLEVTDFLTFRKV